MSLVASATEHECAFSYMGIERYNIQHAVNHEYTDGNGVEHICEVTLHQYREIWKCACQAIEYRNYTNVPKHSGACGQ